MCGIKNNRLNERNLITNWHILSGLNMVKINTFMKCPKIARVKQLVHTANTPWTELLLSQIPFKNWFINTSMGLFKTIVSTTTNEFWKKVLLEWSFLLFKTIPTNYELPTYSVWYNPQITTQPLFIGISWSIKTLE